MIEVFLWTLHGIGCFLLGWGVRGLSDIFQRRIERNKQRGDV